MTAAGETTGSRSGHATAAYSYLCGMTPRRLTWGGSGIGVRPVTYAFALYNLRVHGSADDSADTPGCHTYG